MLPNKIRMTKFRLRLVQILYLSFAGAIALAIQTFGFPLVGKKVEDRSSTYSYQLNFWSNEVFNRFEEISKLEVYERISFTQPRTDNDKFINDVAAYHSQMQHVLRLLSYQGQVLVRISDEMMPLIASTLPSAGKARREELKTHFKQFAEEAERQRKIKTELEQFSVQLRAAYSPLVGATPGQEQLAEAAMKRLKALIALGSNPELLLGKDPLQFVRNFGKAQDEIFKDYGLLVEEHNRLVARDEFWRNFLLLMLALITASLMFNAELKAAQAVNQPG